jgi:site-specific recombinase XerD
MKRNLSSLILRWLASRDLAENTRRLYELELNRFASWITLHQRPLSAIRSSDLREYLDVLAMAPDDRACQFSVRRRKPLSGRSLEQTRRILHAFFEWAARHRHVKTSPFWEAETSVSTQLTQRVPAVAAPKPTAEMTALLRGKVGRIDDLRQLRTAAISHLIFWLGASAKEVARLTIGDIHVREGRPFVSLAAPGGGYVDRLLPGKSHEVLQRYLTLRLGVQSSPTMTGPLICSLRSGKGISPAAIAQILRAMKPPALEPNEPSRGAPSARQLRQLFLSLAGKEGIQDRAVAKHLRVSRLYSAVDQGDPAYEPNRLYMGIENALRIGPH